MKNDLYPFDGKYLDLDGIRYHYLDEGEGEPVVMVHGNPSWSFYYRELVKSLSGRYRVIVPDHIGCGLSDKPDDSKYPYTLARRVEDLTTLLDELGLEKVNLVVHDWGGMIGFAWATRHPDQVSRLTVLNTAAFHLPAGKAFPGTLALARVPGLGALLVRGASAFSRGANRMCVTRRPMPAAVAQGYLAPYDSWKNRVAVHRFVQDIPLSPGDPSYEVVSETQDHLTSLSAIPMMICWGMKDFVFDHRFLDEWVRRFPDADVHRFEDCGHYVLEDATDEIVSLVDEFLGRPEGAA